MLLPCRKLTAGARTFTVDTGSGVCKFFPVESYQEHIEMMWLEIWLTIWMTGACLLAALGTPAELSGVPMIGAKKYAYTAFICILWPILLLAMLIPNEWIKFRIKT